MFNFRQLGFSFPLTLLTTRLKGYDTPLPFHQEALIFPNNKIPSISCGMGEGKSFSLLK